MTENTTAEFKSEGQKLFENADSENDNSSSSPEVDQKETSNDQTGSSDQDNKQTDENKNGAAENLANHPRWKEREDDWKSRYNEQEQRHIAEIGRLREEFMGKLPKDNTLGKGPVEIPPWFGGDEKQWSDFLEFNKTFVSQAKSEALKEIETKSAAEQKAIADATTYFNDQVGALEADKTLNPQGEKVDRNKLLKFVLDNDLVDSQGRWNYRAGFQMMKVGATTAKTEGIAERKKIAGATTSENRSETKQPTFKTSADFKKAGERPW